MADSLGIQSTQLPKGGILSIQPLTNFLSARLWCPVPHSWTPTTVKARCLELNKRVRTHNGKLVIEAMAHRLLHHSGPQPEIVTFNRTAGIKNKWNWQGQMLAGSSSSPWIVRANTSTVITFSTSRNWWKLSVLIYLMHLTNQIKQQRTNLDLLISHGFGKETREQTTILHKIYIQRLQQFQNIFFRHHRY